MKENSISGWKLNLHKDDIKRNWQNWIADNMKITIKKQVELTLKPECFSGVELADIWNYKKICKYLKQVQMKTLPHILRGQKSPYNTEMSVSG